MNSPDLHYDQAEAISSHLADAHKAFAYFRKRQAAAHQLLRFIIFDSPSEFYRALGLGRLDVIVMATSLPVWDMAELCNCSLDEVCHALDTPGKILSRKLIKIVHVAGFKFRDEP